MADRRWTDCGCVYWLTVLPTSCPLHLKVQQSQVLHLVVAQLRLLLLLHYLAHLDSQLAEPHLQTLNCLSCNVYHKDSDVMSINAPLPVSMPPMP